MPRTSSDHLTRAMVEMADDIEKTLERFQRTLEEGVKAPGDPCEELGDEETAAMFDAVARLTRVSDGQTSIVSDLVVQLGRVRAAMGITPACPCHTCATRPAASARPLHAVN